MYDREKLCTVKLVFDVIRKTSKNLNTIEKVLKMYHRMYQDVPEKKN